MPAFICFENKKKICWFKHNVNLVQEKNTVDP